MFALLSQRITSLQRLTLDIRLYLMQFSMYKPVGESDENGNG